MIKNITKNLLLILFVGALSFQSQAQGMKERTADQHFAMLSYERAAEIYSDLAKKSDATDHQIRRAAESYREIGDSENAEKWYRKLSTHSGVKAEDFYHFAQMLKLNEKYDEANKAMATFKSKSPNNSIAASHSENADYVAKLKSMPNKYNIAIFDVNSATSDFAPNYYTKDGETKIVFASARTQNTGAFSPQFQWDKSNFLDVYYANIGGDGENVNVKKFDRGIKSKYHEGPASFSNNGDVMYLSRSNYIDKKKGLDTARHNNIKLFIAKRDSNGKWGELMNFPYNSDNYSLGQASVTEDGKTMYFTSDMPGSLGETDIWMSQLVGSKWSKPMNLKDVNTEGREMFPFIGKDGTLYFSTDGYAGLGGLDVYRATAKSTSSFDEPENMMYPLNTNHDDFGLIINQAQTEGYFSSNRNGEGSMLSNDDIYRFEMLVPFKPKFHTIRGCAKTQGEEVIPATTVKLVNTETGETVKKTLSQSGCYEFENVPSGKYRVEGMKPEWTKISDYEFNTDDSEGVNIEDADVYLKAPECSLLGSVVNGNNNEPLSGVKLIIKDKRTGRVMSYLTDAKGQFTDPLNNIPCPGGYLDYEISLSKDGFFPKIVDFSHAIMKPGVVDLSAYLGGPIPMFDAGAFCQINPILYDFDESYIRPDAAVELDKLVQCMKDNPDIVVEIGSHTDCRASITYNVTLSDRRAKAARAYVIKKGIDASRIYGRGYGESRLLKNCPCEPTNDSDCSEELHQLNRRTEFRIVSGGANVKNNSTNSF